MKQLAITISLLSTITIVGCSGTTHTDKWDKIKETTSFEVNENLKKNKALLIPKENSSDHVKDEFFVGFTTLDIVKRNRNNLPKEFYSNASVFSKTGVAEENISELIYKDFGIIVEFVKQKTGSSISSVEDEEIEEETSSLDLFDTSPVTETGSLATTSQEEEEEENLIEYNYNGDLKGLLDYITISIDKKWEYDAESQKVYVYRYRTETFELLQSKESIAKSTSITTESNGSNTDEGGSSGNNQTIQFSAELNSWDDMQKNIENMLSEDATSSFDPTQGTVIVTDGDYVLSGIRKYINKLNTDSSKQVVIDMRIVNVKINDSSDYGMNWNAVNQAVSSSLFGGSIEAGLNFANSTPSTGSISLNNTSTGMSALFSALNEFSNFKVQNTINAITLNNKPVPLQVTTDVGYVSGFTPGETDEAGNVSAPTYETSTIKQGITVTITPKIHEQNIVLDYSMNLSVLDELKTVGETEIQTPIVSSKNFTQRIIAKNGEPLIVASFDKENESGGSASPFSGDLWFLGGKETTSGERETILIVITPYIVGNK